MSTSTNMKRESIAMRWCRYVGLESVAWSLRRLHCPVDKDALVLEVGSGGNPYFRSNVLLDAYEDTRERHWAPLITDRPTVIGFVERLPFKDKAFDFVIASHVLEHSGQPTLFLQELQRVAKAGYIETPDAFMERINPYRDHRLEVTVRGNRLIIRKKHAWKGDRDLVDLYEARAKAVLTAETMRRHPFEFHVRYYWSDVIDGQVENPDTDAMWNAPASDRGELPRAGVRARIGQGVLRLIRYLFSQRRRNAKLQLRDLLACPSCSSGELSSTSPDAIRCGGCGVTYAVHNGIPLMRAV